METIFSKEQEKVIYEIANDVGTKVYAEAIKKTHTTSPETMNLIKKMENKFDEKFDKLNEKIETILVNIASMPEKLNDKFSEKFARKDLEKRVSCAENEIENIKNTRENRNYDWLKWVIIFIVGFFANKFL